jgi:hypothetical protein
VALVITLLMLSVITFLAIAFLAMSRRNQSAVSASLDTTTARAMSEAAQARAQAEIMAQILTSGDALQYDYTVSRNYIYPGGFNDAEKGVFDPNNVNYDFLANPGRPFANIGKFQEDWVQNIANLYYDPRPPVFVVTNTAFPYNYDFRFWVDINRNGRFETNGYQPTLINDNPPPGPEQIVLGSNAVLNGEPEFIGVLKNPLYHHSSSNQFIGRYAYLVLPIGKTLDLNYIHNFLKGALEPAQMGQLTNMSIGPSFENDGFSRDQGIGSWELNLAALLDAVSPYAYESSTGNYQLNGYDYRPPNPNLGNIGLPNRGSAFDDAEAILHYRYMPPNYYLESLFLDYPSNHLDFLNNYMDIYCADSPTNAPFDYNGTNYPVTPTAYKTLVTEPWPGSYQTNLFFDVQDLFDPTKTSLYFTNRMILASQRTNTDDRYTFQRLLSCIGMGSSPEYGVWVYDDNGRPTLRTKVNINYDNTVQITNVNAPYVPMATNLVFWRPVNFFTNAAELLLRSQGYVYSNYYVAGGRGYYTITSNYCGVTNIPIYRASYPGVHYDATVHRMLQLAANIFDATNPTNYDSEVAGLPPVRHPSVFRPVFQVLSPGTTNAGLNIAGYVQVTNDAYYQMLKPFQAATNVLRKTIYFDTNGNVAGIPWVVAANKGLPGFYHYNCGTQVLLERKLLFPRYIVSGVVQTNRPPQYTNQFFCMAVTNGVGMDSWNPYPTAFSGASGSLHYYFSNYITIQLTNEYNFGTNIVLAISNTLNLAGFIWNPGGGNVGSKAGVLPVFNNTNLVTLPESYFSATQNPNGFYYLVVTNGNIQDTSFLPSDMQQKGWPVYNWTLNVTNHIVYALFDGDPREGAPVLDFVNLGPFGVSVSLTNAIALQNSNPLNFNGGGGLVGSYWAPGNATSLPTSPMSAGVLNQIATGEEENQTFALDLIGKGNSPDAVLDCPYNPTWIIQVPTNWVANDPLVHYTLEDLTWSSDIQSAQQAYDVSAPNSPRPPPLSNSIGIVSGRYAPWGARDTIGNNMLFKDPLITNSFAWQFPTNKFPGVGWIGRVHRGTPWQTVFLKADTSQNPAQSYALWSNWANPNWVTAPYAPETYPTNDWPLVDVFTTALNDNAARGLLSVNQTNDAAWAAVFGGVIALTNAYGGVQIMPNNNGRPYGIAQNFTNLMDGPYGINAFRSIQPNGIFHKAGYILGAPALTVNSPFLGGNAADVPYCTDEVVERIPQQVLSLLKVGEPQFVIFAWGQALKPKGPPFLGLGANANTYTNYEITGECLTRTVCHLVHTNGLKMVIDSYNVESGN